MIVMLTASSILLAGLQASINAPTEAFRGCLKGAAAKAKDDKVAPDGIETYLKTECKVQLDSLQKAVVAFRVKNGMSRKAALEDANMTTDDYVASPADNYRYFAEKSGGNAATSASAPAPAAPAAASAPATPASAPAPKP